MTIYICKKRTQVTDGIPFGVSGMKGHYLRLGQRLGSATTQNQSFYQQLLECLGCGSLAWPQFEHLIFCPTDQNPGFLLHSPISWIRIWMDFAGLETAASESVGGEVPFGSIWIFPIELNRVLITFSNWNNSHTANLKCANTVQTAQETQVTRGFWPRVRAKIRTWTLWSHNCFAQNTRFLNGSVFCEPHDFWSVSGRVPSGPTATEHWQHAV